MADSIPVSGRSQQEATGVVVKAGPANVVRDYGERLAVRYLVESGLLRPSHGPARIEHLVSVAV